MIIGTDTKYFVGLQDGEGLAFLDKLNNLSMAEAENESEKL